MLNVEPHPVMREITDPDELVRIERGSVEASGGVASLNGPAAVPSSRKSTNAKKLFSNIFTPQIIDSCARAAKNLKQLEVKTT